MYTALVYLSDVGGLSIILNQTRTSTLARHAWVISPSYGQVALFQSSRLHGALPEMHQSSGGAADGHRMTINIAFWYVPPTVPSAALTITALRLPGRSRLCTPFEQECQLSAGDAGDGSSRSPFSWEHEMPAGSPSPGDDKPERLEIMQYDGEVWDTTGRSSTGPSRPPTAPQVRFKSILVRLDSI